MSTSASGPTKLGFVPSVAGLPLQPVGPLLLALLLVQAPAGDSPTTPDAYAETRARVQAAVKLANRDPRAGAELLEQALDELSHHTLELSTDELALQERALAQLALARSYLALNNSGAANRAMDRALRSALGSELPVARYGPNMIALHDARKQALEDAGRVSLEVKCYVRCRFIVDGRAGEGLELSLYAGTYDVFVIALDAEVSDLHRTLSFDADEPVELIEFGKPEVAAPAVVERPAPAIMPVDKPSRRAMPRWAELLIMTAGTGIAVTGGVMWAYDERCPGGQDPQIDFEACPSVYDTSGVGVGLTLLGAGVFAVGGVTLLVDELRMKRAKMSLSVVPPRPLKRRGAKPAAPGPAWARLGELSLVWTISF